MKTAVMWCCFAARKKGNTLAYDFSCWTISGTFSPRWILKISSLHKEVSFNYGEERKDQDRDSLWLLSPPFFHFLLAEEGRKGREERGAWREREATGDLLDYQCDARPGLNEPSRGRERGGYARVKGKGVCVEVRGWGDWCVHFLRSLLGGSRRWIFTQSSPLHTPPCHWKVCENSTHKSGASASERTKEEPEARKEASAWFTGRLKCYFAFSFVRERDQLTNNKHDKRNVSTASHYFQFQVSQWEQQ